MITVEMISVYFSQHSLLGYWISQDFLGSMLPQYMALYVRMLCVWKKIIMEGFNYEPDIEPNIESSMKPNMEPNIEPKH